MNVNNPYKIVARHNSGEVSHRKEAKFPIFVIPPSTFDFDMRSEFIVNIRCLPQTFHSLQTIAYERKQKDASVLCVCVCVCVWKQKILIIFIRTTRRSRDSLFLVFYECARTTCPPSRLSERCFTTPPLALSMCKDDVSTITAVKAISATPSQCANTPLVAVPVSRVQGRRDAGRHNA